LKTYLQKIPESRRLNVELYILADYLHFAPKLFNLLVNEVSIYYGEKSSPLLSIPFDEEILSYPFCKELELTHGAFILKVGNINETNLQKIYYQSETTTFVRLYRVIRDCKKFSIITSLSQLNLEDLKLSVKWNYSLEYLKNKKELMFSGAMTRELLIMIFNLYDLYDRLSYSFPSESDISNNIKNKNINLIKREGSQILKDGEVFWVNHILSIEAINLKKPPMSNNSYWIISNYFQKEKIIEQWKNFPSNKKK
jgi:hypothetical protein